jgi:hypothetical protein
MVVLKFSASLAAPSINTMRKTAMKTMTDKCYTSASKCFTAGILEGGVLGLNMDFAISIIDDADLEGDETVNLPPRSLDSGASFSSPSTTVLPTADNEVVASVKAAATIVDTVLVRR